MAPSASSDDFLVIDGLDVVRFRPGLGAISSGSDDIALMLWGLVGVALDEHLAGAATRICVDVDGQGMISVEDDGGGIPVKNLEPFFTTVTGASLEGRRLLRPTGLGGLNSLSSRLEVETSHHRVVFSRGQVIEPVRNLGSSVKSGTVIRVLPDEEIFKEARLDLSAIERVLTELAWLCPKLELRFQGRSLARPAGLAGWLQEVAPELVKETLLTAKETVNDFEIEVAFAWRPRAPGHFVRSFVNYAETPEGGSHERGLVSAVEQVIAAKRASRVKRVLSGLLGIVHVVTQNPKLQNHGAGFDDKAARNAVRDVVTRAINQAPWWWDKLHTAIG